MAACDLPHSPKDSGVSAILRAVQNLPLSPGVYRMVDEVGAVLYVGKASNLSRRVQSYTQTHRLPVRLQRMVAQTRNVLFDFTQTESEALLLESFLIKKFHPPFNILLKDGKDFFSLFVSDHPYPRLGRARGKLTGMGRVFGPFLSKEALKDLVDLVHKVFRLRNCTDPMFQNRTRPCLEYDMKRCSAPCVGRISQEAYQESVEQAVSLLAGQSEELVAALSQKMLEARHAERFEEAARYRDQIQAVRAVWQPHGVCTQSPLTLDVWASCAQSGVVVFQLFSFRHGRSTGGHPFSFREEEGATLEGVLMQFYTEIEPPARLVLPEKVSSALGKALQELWGKKVSLETVGHDAQKRNCMALALDSAGKQAAYFSQKIQSERAVLARLTAFMDLPTCPERIEAYDNSHLMGTHPLCAMIVGGKDGFLKRAYRALKPPPELAQNDVGMMEWIFSWRAQSPTPLPDLIIIDGGPVQLQAARRQLPESVPLLAISKGPQRKDDVIHRVGYPPTRLDAQDPLLYYLQRLRDEAHRFVQSSHQHRRTKGLTRKPKWQEIPGLGPKRRQALLGYFGSLKGLMEAGLEDLVRVPGISRKLAQDLHDFFRN